MHSKNILINQNMHCSCYPSQLKWHVFIQYIKTQVYANSYHMLPQSYVLHNQNETTVNLECRRNISI